MKKTRLNLFPRAVELYARPRGNSEIRNAVMDRFHNPVRGRGEITGRTALTMMRFGTDSVEPLSSKEVRSQYLDRKIGERFINFRLGYTGRDGEERRTSMRAFGQYTDEPARVIGYTSLVYGTMLESRSDRRPGNLFRGAIVVPDVYANELMKRAEDDPLYPRQFAEDLIESTLATTGMQPEDFPKFRPQHDLWIPGGINRIAIQAGKPGELRESVVKIEK